MRLTHVQIMMALDGLAEQFKLLDRPRLVEMLDDVAAAFVASGPDDEKVRREMMDAYVIGRADVERTGEG